MKEVERGVFLLVSPALNVAAAATTTVLGPGLRGVVWVQGCPFDCRGCMAPEWIPDRPAQVIDPGELAERLLADPRVTGLTFSGGEPMRQAEGLAALAAHARARALALGRPEPDIICFTGFRLSRLRRRPPYPGVADLLGRLDVLIDGQYVARLDDGRGLRGSANQTVHHLTGRLRHAASALADGPRSARVTVRGSELTIIGVPPPGLLSSVRHPAAADAAAARAPRTSLHSAARGETT
ncbi:radical SAM protein [Streptomyces sp. NBC_01410]|uniref:4Fe-4S single cluster domain-containing protein n=1 Tax=Streptomyces sp. NBC_01410 TaxID=2903856 RepID=UPI003252B75F